MSTIVIVSSIVGPRAARALVHLDDPPSEGAGSVAELTRANLLANLVPGPLKETLTTDNLQVATARDAVRLTVLATAGGLCQPAAAYAVNALAADNPTDVALRVTGAPDGEELGNHAAEFYILIQYIEPTDRAAALPSLDPICTCAPGCTCPCCNGRCAS